MSVPVHNRFGYELTDGGRFKYFSKIFAIYQLRIRKYWDKTQSEDWDAVDVLPEAFRLDYLANQFEKDYEERYVDDDGDEEDRFEIETKEKGYELSDDHKRLLNLVVEGRRKENPDEDEDTLTANAIKELAEEYGHPWLKLYPPANQLPGKRYKTITDAQLAEWKWDDDHMIHIVMPKKHLLDWFDNVHADEDEGFEFDFEKYDEDFLVITEPNPEFWTECSQEDFEQAVLDRLNLKEEWIDSMTVDG